jgi:hypothetical protein
MGWAALAITVILVGFGLYVLFYYLKQAKKKQELEEVKQMKLEALEDLGMLSFQSLDIESKAIMVGLAHNPAYLKLMWEHPEEQGQLNPVLSTIKRAHSAE